MNVLKAVFSSAYLPINLRPVWQNLGSVRNAGGKGVKRNTRQKAKAPGVKRCDGDFVRRGEVLVSQFALHFHPGLNVDIDNKNTLTAMAEGQVIMTCEKINPKKENYTAQKYYANISAPVIYKKIFHVLPFKQGKKFKLVDLV